jgi:hypothetical protein
MWLVDDNMDPELVNVLEYFEQLANVQIEARTLTTDRTVGLIKVRAIEDGIKFGYWTKLDSTKPLSELMVLIEAGYVWSLTQSAIEEGQTYHEYIHPERATSVPEV